MGKIELNMKNTTIIKSYCYTNIVPGVHAIFCILSFFSSPRMRKVKIRTHIYTPLPWRNSSWSLPLPHPLWDGNRPTRQNPLSIMILYQQSQILHQVRKVLKRNYVNSKSFQLYGSEFFHCFQCFNSYPYITVTLWSFFTSSTVFV